MEEEYLPVKELNEKYKLPPEYTWGEFFGEPAVVGIDSDSDSDSDRNYIAWVSKHATCYTAYAPAGAVRGAIAETLCIEVETPDEALAILVGWTCLGLLNTRRD